MNKIVLSTILPERKYIQLGLHNLKAHSMCYCKCRDDITIDIYEINAGCSNFMRGSVFPYIDKQDVFSHAIKILKKKPTIIGFSCFMWNIEPILQICKVIKTINKNVLIVLGGGEASADPEELLHKNTFVDLVVVDEGELAFSELLDTTLSNSKDLSKIKGIVYRKGGKVIRTDNADVIDLQKLPSPYLNHQIKLDGSISLALETSRGCPFNCSYCTYSIRGYHKLRFLPMDRVLKELKYILMKNPKSLRITDDNFNINPPRAALILKQIAKYRKDTEIKIFLNGSMWKIDKKLITLLKKVDVTCSVGVQSINNMPLKHINRKNDFAVLEDNLRTFDRMGLFYELSFILGLPGENYKEFKDSIDWAFKFDPKEINLFPLMVFKGTKMNEDAKKLGLGTYGEPFYTVKETKKMTKLDIKKGLMLREHIGLLYNQGLLRKTVRYVAKQYDLNLTEIMEIFEKSPVLEHAVKGNTKIQRELIHYLTAQIGNKMDKQILIKTMKEDHRYFVE